MPESLDSVQETRADFEQDLQQRLSSIREKAYDDSIAPDVAIPYLPGWPDTPPEFGQEEYWWWWEHHLVPFRRDIDSLLLRLGVTMDGADPAAAEAISESLADAADHLAVAENYRDGPISNFSSFLFEGWNSPIAGSLNNSVLTRLPVVVATQHRMAHEIEVAARAYAGIIHGTWHLSRRIARQVDERIVRTPVDVQSVLVVVGVVAAAVATGGKAVGLAAWAAGSAATLNGLRDAAPAEIGDESKGELQVKGEAAAVFVPSADEQLSKLWDAIVDEEALIRDGLRNDDRTLRDNNYRDVEIRFDDIDRMSEVDDLRPQETSIDSVARLKVGGATYLPAMAQLLHQAHLSLAGAFWHADNLFGSHVVVGRHRSWFDRTLQTLDDGIVKTRDTLSECGRRLSEIAENYAEQEGLTEELISKVEALLAQDDYDQPPRLYEPPVHGDRSVGPQDIGSRQ